MKLNQWAGVYEETLKVRQAHLVLCDIRLLTSLCARCVSRFAFRELCVQSLEERQSAASSLHARHASSHSAEASLGSV